MKKENVCIIAAINVNTHVQKAISINELLDFRKHEQGMYKIHVSEHDIVKFTKIIYESFYPYSQSKELKLNFSSSYDAINVYFDSNQLQKAINNLLSNAFKFTPKGGEVSISIKKDDNFLYISVIDSGIGIDADSKYKIFDRFYQVDNLTNNDLYQTGTGIGLSLTQSIVAAHFGEITVVSEENKGSEFTIKLLLGKDHFEGKDKVEIITPSQNSITTNILEPIEEDFKLDIIENLQLKNITQSTILIVEDDDSLRKMLLQIFDPFAITLEAKNGLEGLNITKEKMPDLVLSDIMMPGMSGYEMCAKIKSNFETCHISVILLTALNTVEQNIGGINSGADDYITKPFNTKLLVTKCLGLLNNKRVLKEKFSKQIGKDAIVLSTNVLDQQFIEKAISIIEKNIENGEINVSLLCSELAVSRTILFTKIKGITGLTPHEFIQSTKLKLAAKMIREFPNMKIIEISDLFAFSSINHFGKLFKEQFGVSPLKMRKT